MNREYRNKCYRIIIASPQIMLFYGQDQVGNAVMNKDEIEVDTVKRVINKYLKSGAYTNWLNICKIAGDKKERTEETWLEFLQESTHARLLRSLLKEVEKDIGGADGSVKHL